MRNSMFLALVALLVCRSYAETSDERDARMKWQYIPATGVAGVDWETCMTMNGTWGYSAHDANWKSGDDMILKKESDK